MRPSNLLATLILILAFVSRAEPAKPITDFAFSAETLITTPMDEMRQTETFSLDDLTDKDRKAALSRIAEFPKLATLKLYSCDLSHVDEKDAVPAKVKAVIISGGKVSQGTIRWLAKFPSGIEIWFGSCDVRKLDLDLGKFKWVSFDDCEMSRSAITKLIENTMQVIFKEVKLDAEK
jgi:hypothetical protein